MVVNLSIDTKDLFAVGTDQRLFAGGRINNREALVRQDRAFSLINAAPIRTTMANSFTHFQGLFSKGAHIAVNIKYRCNTTHGCLCFMVKRLVFLRGSDRSLGRPTVQRPWLLPQGWRQ